MRSNIIKAMAAAVLLIAARPSMAMNPTILGTPTVIAPGATYAPASGTSSRVVVIFAWTQAAQATLTNCVWNGYTVTPLQTLSNNNGVGIGVCVFTDAQLPASAAAPTINWSAGGTSDTDILPITVDYVNQSTPVRNSTTGTPFTTNPSVTLTGLVAGDLVLGQGLELVGNISFTGWQNSLTQIVRQLESGGGNYINSAYKTAASSSEAYGITSSSAEAMPAAVLALEPSGGSGPSQKGGMFFGEALGRHRSPVLAMAMSSSGGHVPASNGNPVIR